MISRRRFTQALAGTAAATPLASCSREDPPAPVATASLRAGSGKNTALGPVKQIEAGVLNVGYAEFGPVTGQPVLLLHGWPYDARSYMDVAPLLAAEGYRVIVRACAATGRPPSRPRSRTPVALAAAWVLLVLGFTINTEPPIPIW